MQLEITLLEPAVKFIEGLDAKLGAKALRTIELLQYFGPQLPMPHARKLEGEELYELRVRYSTNICRLFYFHYSKKAYVVTSGYVKKSQKTSLDEIRKALRIRDIFLAGGKK